jgi:hypothetical protein
LGNLSKSKLLAFRQCKKRLWLEVHRPELREDSDVARLTLQAGLAVGEAARRLYDRHGDGTTINPQKAGYDQALKTTRALLQTAKPLFEAGFAADGAIAFADILLPVKKRKRLAWRIIEVKSSSSVKDYHRDDAAIQAYVTQAAGVPLASIAVAHIDTTWVYPGKEKYDGLLVEQDVTDEAVDRAEEVKEWVTEARSVASAAQEPKQTTGAHCMAPYECGFLAYCRAKEPQPQFPIDVLPRISKKLRSLVEEKKLTELKQVPDKLLNETQLRVKRHTLKNKVYFDAKGAAEALAQYSPPALFLDFETISFAVPIWPGTRPYEQIPFQFSVHTVSATCNVDHTHFLDLSGNDPSSAFAKALVGRCARPGPLFVYNAGFEKARITELAHRFPKQRKALIALNERLVDLLPIAQRFYYHPNQQGSWSIKAVLSAVAPTLTYKDLTGVQDGGMAMDAYLEAIYPETTAERRASIQDQLLNYCKLDTYALVRLWQVFSGRSHLTL